MSFWFTTVCLVLRMNRCINGMNERMNEWRIVVIPKLGYSLLPASSLAYTHARTHTQPLGYCMLAHLRSTEISGI